jgi:hypothetical protein
MLSEGAPGASESAGATYLSVRNDSAPPRVSGYVADRGLPRSAGSAASKAPICASALPGWPSVRRPGQEIRDCRTDPVAMPNV